jgi:hypothetical protein
LSLFLVFLFFNYNSGVRSMMQSIRILDALAAYEVEYEFARQVSLPVEDRMKFMPQAKWEGGYRWFRSPNVICLEKVRRLKQRSDG